MATESDNLRSFPIIKFQTKWDYLWYQIKTLNITNIALIITVIILSAQINGDLNQIRVANSHAQTLTNSIDDKINSLTNVNLILNKLEILNISSNIILKQFENLNISGIGELANQIKSEIIQTQNLTLLIDKKINDSILTVQNLTSSIDERVIELTSASVILNELKTENMNGSAIIEQLKHLNVSGLADLTNLIKSKSSTSYQICGGIVGSGEYTSNFNWIIGPTGCSLTGHNYHTINSNSNADILSNWPISWNLVCTNDTTLFITFHFSIGGSASTAIYDIYPVINGILDVSIFRVGPNEYVTGNVPYLHKCNQGDHFTFATHISSNSFNVFGTGLTILEIY